MSTPGRLFDRYLVVDWSAANAPRRGRDSIWVCDRTAGGATATANPSTRGKAVDLLRSALVQAVSGRERVLVGFDFPLAYPAGLAAALGLPEPGWSSIWRLLRREAEDDRLTNANNRFEVADRLNRRLGAMAAFWGRPVARADLSRLPVNRLVSYRSADRASGLGEWREVEAVLRREGLRPHSAWKLLGAGSVGGQALTGIPAVASLRWDPALKLHSRVWPFEVEVPRAGPGPGIVHAEVWPALIDCTTAPGRFLDARQVWALAEELDRLDGAGALGGLLAAATHPRAGEEGWIVGVTRPGT